MYPEFAYLLVGLAIFTFASFTTILYFEKKNNS